MPHAIKTNRTIQEYGAESRKPVFEHVIAMMNGETQSGLSRRLGLNKTSIGNRCRNREIPLDDRYFAWLRALTPAKRKRYGHALDVLKMQHPEAVDYVNGE